MASRPRQHGLPEHTRAPPAQVSITTPLPFDTARYASFIRLMGYSDVPSQLPLTFPVVEAFRLTMLCLAHPDFPFNPLGAILARNAVRVARPLTLEDELLWRWAAEDGGGGGACP